MKSFILLPILLSICLLTGQTFAQPHAVDGEYIREWLVLGPFFPNDLDTDFLADVGGEAEIHPREGDTVTTADGRELRWQRYASKWNHIYLVHAVGSHRQNPIYYAFCLLQSRGASQGSGNEAASDARVYLGSEGGIAVWINGKRVHYNPIYGDYLTDKDVFEVGLEAGANRCLVKASQRTEMRSLGFSTRVDILPSNRAVLSGMITSERGGRNGQSSQEHVLSKHEP